MAFKPNVWNQLKNLSKGELISALERDGWQKEGSSHSAGSIRLYIKYDPTGIPAERVEIHYHHASDTCGPKLLKALLADTGWSESDMRRLKLLK
jgi:predicted RNA binding protein YcfA (HicA-like mRNA interferase family)